jgi:serine/threonine protein kinase
MCDLFPPNRQSLVGNRFKILNKAPLGEGKFGIVYLAIDVKDNTQIALKQFRGRLVQDGINYNTIQEIRQLSEISHPNIVRFLGVFRRQNSLYMATEILPISLHSLIYPEDRQPILSPGTIKSCLRMLLEGVCYLHSNGIFHRDLKPQNLMFSQSGVLKLIDFGLSIDFPCDFGPMILQVGTQWYKAPELCYGSKAYGPPIDIWAVGCIFAEMMIGRPLFAGENECDYEQLRLIANFLGPIHGNGFVRFKPDEPLQPLSATFSMATEDAIDLLSRLIAIDPRERISALDALRHAYFGTPPAATPVSDLHPFKSCGIEHQTAWAGVGQPTKKTKLAPGTAAAQYMERFRPG